MARPLGVRPLRGRAVGVLRVAERDADWIPRGRVHAGRVRSDAAPAARPERAGGRGAPPLGRQLSRGPGLLAAGRHLPRRLSRGAARRAPPGLPGAHGSRRRVPRRRARGACVAREPVRRRRPRPCAPRGTCRAGRPRGLCRGSGRAGPDRAGRRGRAARVGGGPGPGALDGRDGRALHARRRAPRRVGRGPRGRVGARRVQEGRDQGGAAAAERRADHVPGREPARVRPGSRARGVTRACSRTSA